MISILVAGSYLATLTKELGLSDSFTGVLSSIISLGYLFQLMSLSLRYTKIKKIVVILSIINQFLFNVIPLTSFDKNILRVTVVFILYYIVTYISTPFHGIHQIGELGLNLKFVSATVMCGSVSGIFVSKFWGRYADKKSFVLMIEKGFIFLGVSQICVIFAVPAPGKIMFILYNILYGIALGGISSALINLVFDYVPIEKRADSLDITQSVAGLTCYLTTLYISPLVSHIQNNGNKVLGLPIYSQKFFTILALIFTILAVVYIRVVFRKKQS